MKAALIEAPGPPDVLKISELPMPESKDGWVRIQIKAFGLNRSEMYTRQGHTPNFIYPRVLGIECVGLVDDCPSGRFPVGSQVAAIMGGMGRQFDGGYAEYTSVPERCVIPFTSSLPWEVLGAIPEMFQTANGSLELALELKKDELLLIRGGTSSVGMMATQIAKTMGAFVIATTRNPNKKDALLENGADDVFIDDGNLAQQVRQKYEDGVHKVLELVGTKTLRDSLQCARLQGIVCQTGILGNEWVWKDFEPFLDIPPTVRLTCYGGDSDNLSQELLQRFLDNVAVGAIKVNIDRVFSLNEIADAHAYMESNQAKGKLVVLL